MSSGTWTLAVHAGAERVLARLPHKIAAAVVEFMVGPLCEEPTRVGKPLRKELDGLYVARRGAYRVVYALDDEEHMVMVLRIDHRADIYRPR
jgi:mRNA-degrading endonuclease RelE of RelBE toxin-antitoxin system